MKKILLITLLAIITPFSIVKAESFGIPSSSNNIRPDAGEYNEIINSHNAYYLGNDTNSMYLTFDTGYELGYTASILDTLKQKNVKAAFFITGQFIKENPDLVLRMYNEGHIVANHTNTHPNIDEITLQELEIELTTIEEKYLELTNSEMKKYIRPPKGIMSEKSLSNLDSLDYVTVYWSLAYVDWYTDRQQGENYAYETVTSRFHNGAIILLHTVSKDNMNALGSIIDKAQKDGYNFETLDYLVLNGL